jgi:hypothetical protein
MGEADGLLIFCYEAEESCIVEREAVGIAGAFIS